MTKIDMISFISAASAVVLAAIPPFEPDNMPAIIMCSAIVLASIFIVSRPKGLSAGAFYICSIAWVVGYYTLIAINNDAIRFGQVNESATFVAAKFLGLLSGGILLIHSHNKISSQ